MATFYLGGIFQMAKQQWSTFIDKIKYMFTYVI